MGGGGLWGTLFPKVITEKSLFIEKLTLNPSTGLEFDKILINL